MSRFRLACSAGILLLVAACLLPGIRLMDLAGVSMPDQDPTPDLVTKQSAAIAVARHRLGVAATTGGALAVCGLVVLLLARKLKRRNLSL